MKNLNFRPNLLLSMIVAVVALALMLHACTKENPSPAGKQQVELSADDLKISQAIQAFKTKMDYQKDNPGYKSGETMSVDSARWYLDAVFNYSYAYTEESFETFNSGTFQITLEKNGQRIDFNEICLAFDDLKQQTLLIYYDTEGDEKELYVSNMVVTEETEATVVIEVTATIGSKTNETPPEFGQWGPFVEGDDWMYGEKLGDCDGNYQWFLDAAIKIQNAINTYRYKYIKDEGPGWYAYYTQPAKQISTSVYDSPQNQILFRNPNDATIDNDRDFYLLYQEDMPNHPLEPCVVWEDMNFYYHGTRKVIYNIIQDNPDVFQVSPLLTFYHCDSIHGIGIGIPDQPTHAHHKIIVTYKTRHISVIDLRTSISE